MSISIHALREEGDSSTQTFTRPTGNFYPRPPRGGRLFAVVKFAGFVVISIHALREEGDRLILLVFRAVTLFLSTPSARRATRLILLVFRAVTLFLSTPSARRATVDTFGFPRRHVISIHALREEGDSKNREKIPAFIPL